MLRRLAFVIVGFVATLALACGDDDGGDTTATPYIAPPPLTIEEAVAEVDAIATLVENPDAGVVDASGIGQFELETRITDVVEGTSQVPGLDQVRQLLEDEDRILAREYVHNNVVETLALPFTEADTEKISADEMSDIDPLASFAARGEDFEVSAIFRDAVVRAIELWYLI